MDIKSKYGLRPIINARGVFTPLGVSRSCDHVADITSQALKHYFDIEELQQKAGEIIAHHCKAEFATITNCASAGITLAIAATMSGKDAAKIARLPDTQGMKNKVVIAAAHNVDYGHPIEQDIRLAGCTPIFAGDYNPTTTIETLNETLSDPHVTALLYVESRLTHNNTPKDKLPSIDMAIDAAHKKNIPIIIDAAAQDMRMAELVASGADLLIFSAQKYLAAPTAGIVLGKRQYVEAVAAQIKGIGRPMKAGKEAILGTIAAIEQRQDTDMDCWSKIKHEEAVQFARQLEQTKYVTTNLVKDPSKGEFWRISLRIDEEDSVISAGKLAQQLQSGNPSIHCDISAAMQGLLNFEVLSLDENERQIIISRITDIMHQANNTRS